MTRYLRIAALMLAAAMVAAPARGQQRLPTTSPVIERGGIGLDEAIARAMANEPGIRAARAEIEASRGRLDQAGVRSNPTLSLERRFEPGRGTDQLDTAGVEWPLDLFRRPARMTTARRNLEAVEFSVRDRERLLIAEVRLQYGLVAAAVRDVAVASDLVGAAERQLALVRARVDVGSTPPLERDLMEVELRRFQTEQLLAAGRAESALVRLKQLLGMSPDEELTLRQPIEALLATDAIATLSLAESLVSTRPDLREADARVAVADARIALARNEGRIDLSVFGAYMRMDAGFSQLGLGATGAPERIRGRFNYLAGGAMIRLPLFNRNRGEIAAAEADRVGAEARREAAQLAARAEVAAAQARDVQAQRAVALYEGSIRDLARRNLQVVRETFDLGRATVFDVLAEQRRYLDIERAYTDALRQAWEARAALKGALGETK